MGSGAAARTPSRTSETVPVLSSFSNLRSWRSSSAGISGMAPPGLADHTIHKFCIASVPVVIARTACGFRCGSGVAGAEGPRRGREAFSLHVPRPALRSGLLLYLREKASRPRRGSAPLRAAIARGLCGRSEEHTSELQSRSHLVCRLLLDKNNTRMAETKK